MLLYFRLSLCSFLNHGFLLFFYFLSHLSNFLTCFVSCVHVSLHVFSKLLLLTEIQSGFMQTAAGRIALRSHNNKTLSAFCITPGCQSRTGGKKAP